MRISGDKRIFGRLTVADVAETVAGLVAAVVTFAILIHFAP